MLNTVVPRRKEAANVPQGLFAREDQLTQFLRFLELMFRSRALHSLLTAQLEGSVKGPDQKNVKLALLACTMMKLAKVVARHVKRGALWSYPMP